MIIWRTMGGGGSGGSFLVFPFCFCFFPLILAFSLWCFGVGLNWGGVGGGFESRFFFFFWIFGYFPRDSLAWPVEKRKTKYILIYSITKKYCDSRNCNDGAWMDEPTDEEWQPPRTPMARRECLPQSSAPRWFARHYSWTSNPAFPPTSTNRTGNHGSSFIPCMNLQHLKNASSHRNSSSANGIKQS